MMYRKIRISIAAVLLVTCASAVFAKHASPTAEIKSGDTIAFLGDSITAGGGAYGGFCRLVIQGLKTKQIRATPVLAGVPGNTSAAMLLRLKRSALDYKPDWVVLAAGVNDIWHHGFTGF